MAMSEVVTETIEVHIRRASPADGETILVHDGVGVLRCREYKKESGKTPYVQCPAGQTMLRGTAKEADAVISSLGLIDEKTYREQRLDKDTQDRAKNA